MKQCLVLALFAACGSMGPVTDGGSTGGGSASAGGSAAAGGSATAGGSAVLQPTGATCTISRQDCQAGLACLAPVGSGSTTVGRCFDGGCDLVRQDCPAGFACGYPPVADGGTVVRACYALRTDGGTTGGLGAPCTTLLDCLPGHLCIASGSSATGFACERFCTSNQHCDGGSSCSVAAPYPNSNEAPLFCQPPPVTCDLLTQAPCAASLGCIAVNGEGACGRVKNVMRGAACQFSNDCARGDICATTCRAICNLDGGSPSCGAGSCSPFSGNLAGVVGYCG